jgi:hypothetical protein
MKIINGAAKEIRSYAGSLFVFLFIVAIIVTFVQYPVLESNKEIVLMLIGSIAASIPVLIGTISGTQTDDINSLKISLQKKDLIIDHLTKCKDDYEEMIINLQREIIKNQDDMFDRFLLKSTLDFDDKKNKNET